jgi:Regulator of chromosome condensation (RCC1) repeat
VHQQEPDRRGRAAGQARRRHRVARTLAAAGLMAAGLATAAAAAPAAAVPAVTTPPPRWIHIAAGWDFTCGIREGNTLWCWGDNGSSSGELGHGPGPDASLPQQITRPTAGWASVTAGLPHACATRTGSTLWCWGTNDDGELGTGSAASPGRSQQVTTPAAGGWASVTAGTPAPSASTPSGAGATAPPATPASATRASRTFPGA